MNTEASMISYLVAALTLALTFGGMTFFSAVMTPLVFSKLPMQIAGPFIRQVFPWYYLSMGTTALLALVALLVEAGGTATWEAVLVSLVLAGFAFARQVLMPMINQARDAELGYEPGAAKRFRRLHLVSVIINGLQWLAVLTVLIQVLV